MDWISEARIISIEDGGWRVEWPGELFGPHSTDCKTWEEVLKELNDIFLPKEKDAKP